MFTTAGWINNTGTSGAALQTNPRGDPMIVVTLGNGSKREQREKRKTLETRQRTGDDETPRVRFVSGVIFRQRVFFPRRLCHCFSNEMERWRTLPLIVHSFSSRIQAAVRFNEIFKTKIKSNGKQRQARPFNFCFIFLFGSQASHPCNFLFP